MVLTLAGSLRAAGFHKAKAAALAAEAHNVKVTILAMYPAEFTAFLAAKKRELGGSAWAHEAGVLAYDGDAFIGDDAAMIVHLRQQGVPLDVLNSSGAGVDFEDMAMEEFAASLATSGKSYAYLDLAMDDGQGMLPVGRLLFELHSDVLPKTCANFTQLCTGAKGPCYVDSPIHRVVADGWVQGGDVVAGNGSGGESAFGQVAIPDEGFSVAHDGAGVLGMANDGPHTAASQFYVTCRAMPTWDGKHVAFGKLIDGARVLEYLNALPTLNGAPKMPVLIVGAGKLAAVEVGAEGAETNDEERAAIKLQALQRSKAVKRQQKEERASAAKMQAARRGQAARRARREEKAAATKVQAMTRGKKTREGKMTRDDAKKLFDSMDTDGSGTISRKELATKLKADDDLEKLLGLKGAKRIGKHFLRVQKELEALDTDGDAKITFKEFAKLLEYVKPPQEPLAPVTEG